MLMLFKYWKNRTFAWERRLSFQTRFESPFVTGETQPNNVPQPSYSSDLAPADFTFPRIKTALNGHRFDDTG